jgi:hypothetical protein
MRKSGPDESEMAFPPERQQEKGNPHRLTVCPGDGNWEFHQFAGAQSGLVGATVVRGGFRNGLPNLVKISPGKIELGEAFAKFERTW